LIAAIVGIDSRSTMDMDATIRGYPLDQEKLKKAISEICSVPIDDDVQFSFKGIVPIRDDDEYGGYRVSIEGVLETIIHYSYANRHNDRRCYHAKRNLV